MGSSVSSCDLGAKVEGGAGSDGSLSVSGPGEALLQATEAETIKMCQQEKQEPDDPGFVGHA